MCSTSTPDCRYDKSTIIIIGDVYCPNTKCSGKICLQKRLFNLSAELIINVRNSHLCARCAISLLKIKQIAFSSRFSEYNVFWETLGAQKNVHSLSRSGYELPHCTSKCQMCKITSEKQTNLFFFSSLAEGIIILNRRKKQFKIDLEIFFVLESSFYD